MKKYLLLFLFLIIITNNSFGSVNIDSNCKNGQNCTISNLNVLGDLNVSGSFYTTNVININYSGQLNLTGCLNFPDGSFVCGGDNQIRTDNPDGTAAFLFFNDIGDQMDVGVRGSNYVNPMGVDGSTMGVRTHNSSLFLATGYNHDILFGSAFDDDDSNLNFSVKIDTLLNALVFLGNIYIRPANTGEGYSLLFQSFESLSAGNLPYIWVAQDGNNDTIVTSWHNNGRNNSYSGQMNSFGLIPKPYITFVGNITDDISGITFLRNRSNYINYCDWLQQNQSLVPEGCKYFADTTGRKVPLLFGGDLEVHRTATIHESLTLFNSFDFIGRSGNDAGFLFNGETASGKVHIRDKRQILTNITFFDFIITDFDDGTINPFISESISPEPGRDWGSVLSLSCHEDRCGQAQGGNEKIMAFSGSTTFENGTVGSSNSRLLFYITSILGGADTLEVELDNNEGNVSIVYSTSASLNDVLINVSFPMEFENRTNVTTRFILNGQNVNRQVWIDIIRVTSEPDEAIEINELYDGGKITLGSDFESSSECYIEKEKFIPEGLTVTENRINLKCQNTNITGNLNIDGNLDVAGCINYNGGSLGVCI